MEDGQRATHTILSCVALRRVASHSLAPTGSSKKAIVVKAKPTQSKTIQRRRSGGSGAKGDTASTILDKLAEMHRTGVKDVKETVLLKATGYAGPDTKTYRNAVRDLVKTLGYVTKTTKNKITTYSLTEVGRDHLIEIGKLVVAPEPTSNDELHRHLRATLGESVKAPVAKLERIFDELLDGQWHDLKDLVAVAGYLRSDSSGYKNIMASLKSLDLLQKSGRTVRFSDKVYPFGRP
mmetsp:Transcript_3930/g.11142  ORF Transcript_3930/g.11142 Transcript_3930/m.11142 type:complete len:236 (-) Transcript_3930:683-1390(-)